MSNIMFTIGPFTMYWYSFFVLSGFLAGYMLLTREFKRQKQSVDFINDYFFYLVPIVILGARIYYVIFEWHNYKDNLGEIIAIWNGGLAIHGGIIAGIIFSIYYTKKHGVNQLKFLDIAAPCLILGQAIGRWGNFFNQEAYGSAVSIDVLKGMFIPNFIIEGMKINGEYYHPTFLYESLLCLVGLSLILFLRSRKNTRIGEQVSMYFMIYGISRFFIESLRTDSLMLGNLRVAQLVSIIMFLGGGGLFIRSRFFTNKLYNEVEEKKNRKHKKINRRAR